MRALLVAVIMLSAGMAGCFDGTDVNYDELEQEIATAIVPFFRDALEDPLVAFDPARHATGINMERVAYSNAFDRTGDANAIPAGGFYHELAVTDNYAYLTRQSADGSYGGFSILNLQKDRDGVPNPVMLSSFEAVPGSDIEVSADEQLAFYASQRNSIEQVAQRGVQLLEPTALPSRGIHVVDISDKANPHLESFTPVPYNGVHAITYHKHRNGQEYVIATSYDILGNTVPSSTVPPAPLPFGVITATQRVEVYQVVRDLAGTMPTTLLRVNQFQITDSPSGGKLFFPHDTSVQVHPETNQTLLYVAYWDKGVRILDFSQPEQPLEEIGAWNDFSPSSTNEIHWVRSFPHKIQGRHITVAEPEVITNPDETGYITFLDTSDPTAPRKAARGSHWTLPVEGIGVRLLEFSPHNFDLWNGKVVMAHYHAGIWIVDVHNNERLADPATVGFTMDVEPREDNPRPSPMYWSAFEHDGLIYAVDEGTGLYVFRYTGP